LKIVFDLFLQNKFLNILSVITTTLFFLIVLILIININQASIETTATNHLKEKNLYQISDSLVEESESEFISDISNYDKLAQFTELLEEIKDLNYIHVIWQPIEVADFKGQAVFDPYYEDGNTMPPYEADSKTYTSVKSMQFNELAIEMNNIQLKKGRFPSEKEFIFNHKSTNVPLVLGSEYSNIYEIDETIEFNYYGELLTGEVVGILSPSQKVTTLNEPELILDRYVIFPSFKFDEEPSEMLKEMSDFEVFIRATLLSRVNGLILTDKSPLEVREIASEVSHKAGFYDFQIIGANSLGINSLVKMAEANRTTIYISLFVFFIIATGIHLLTISLKLKKSVDTYKVLLISGANYDNVFKYVQQEILLTNLIGIGIPIILMLLIPIDNITFIFYSYLFSSLILAILSIFFIKKFITKTFYELDIVQRLKG